MFFEHKIFFSTFKIFFFFSRKRLNGDAWGRILCFGHIIYNQVQKNIKAFLNLIFHFLEAMAWYTAEEACELLTNDENFGEMDAADSLDDNFSDSATWCSEVDSDPENDFIGRTVSVTTQQQRGCPRTRGLQIRGRVRVRGGSFRGRCLRPRGGHGKRLASEALDE